MTIEAATNDSTEPRSEAPLRAARLPGQKTPRGGPEARRVVLVLIMAITASSALSAASGGLIIVMMLLFCFALRQMVEDEITIAFKSERRFSDGK